MGRASEERDLSGILTMTVSVEICATTAIASVVIANVVHSFYRLYWEARESKQASRMILKAIDHRNARCAGCKATIRDGSKWGFRCGLRIGE
jgi:hypothetical protein